MKMERLRRYEVIARLTFERLRADFPRNVGQGVAMIVVSRFSMKRAAATIRAKVR